MKSTIKLSLSVLYTGFFQLVLITLGFSETVNYFLMNAFFLMLLASCLYSSRQIDWLIPGLVIGFILIAISYHGVEYRPLYTDDSLYVEEGKMLSDKPVTYLLGSLFEKNTIRADTYKYITALILKLGSKQFSAILVLNFVLCGFVLRLLSNVSANSKIALTKWFCTIEFIVWSGFAFKDTLVGFLLILQIAILLGKKHTFSRVILFLMSALIIDEFKMGLGWSTILFALIVKSNVRIINTAVPRMAVMSGLFVFLTSVPLLISQMEIDSVHIEKINAYNEFALGKVLGNGLLGAVRNLSNAFIPLKIILLPVPLLLNIELYSITFVLARLITFGSLIIWIFSSTTKNAIKTYINYMLIFWLMWLVIFMPGVVRHIVPFIPLLSYYILYGKSNLFRRRTSLLS